MFRRIALILILASTVLGDICRDEYDINDYLVLAVTTSRFSTGALYTAGDTAVFNIYKVEAGVPNATQVVTDGAMTEDFDSKTGLVVGTIQLSTGNGFAAGGDYFVLITATVDSVAAGVSDTFHIRSAPLATAAGLGSVTLANGAHGGAAATLTLSDYSPFKATGFSTHSAGDVWAVETRALTDKAGFGLADDAITAAKVAAAAWQELIELYFSYDATGNYAGAEAGSLVKEIADNAGGSLLTLEAIAAAVMDLWVSDGLVEADGAARRFTRNALEMAPRSGGR